MRKTDKKLLSKRCPICNNFYKVLKVHIYKFHSDMNISTDEFIKKYIHPNPGICEYGCGQEAKFYIRGSYGELNYGKWCCCKKFNSCKEVRSKNNKDRKNKNMYEIFGEKADEIKLSIKRQGENNPNYGKKQSEESIRKNRESNLNNLLKESHLIKLYESQKMRKMTKMENILFDILNTITKNFEYVGNFSFWIHGRNPDFIDKENKKIIEFFGSYWHSMELRNDNISNEDHEKERINFFKKHDYKTLVIWENELKNIDNLKNKLFKFVEE